MPRSCGVRVRRPPNARSGHRCLTPGQWGATLLVLGVSIPLITFLYVALVPVAQGADSVRFALEADALSEGLDGWMRTYPMGVGWARNQYVGRYMRTLCTCLGFAAASSLCFMLQQSSHVDACTRTLQQLRTCLLSVWPIDHTCVACVVMCFRSSCVLLLSVSLQGLPLACVASAVSAEPSRFVHTSYVAANLRFCFLV